MRLGLQGAWFNLNSRKLTRDQGKKQKSLTFSETDEVGERHRVSTPWRLSLGKRFLRWKFGIGLDGQVAAFPTFSLALTDCGGH